MKPGMRALIVAAPPGYLELLAPFPEGVVVSPDRSGMYSFVQLFATRSSEISTSAPELLQHAAPGALIWIAYPKKTSGIESDLHRDIVCQLMSKTGWRAVSIIAINEVWSALRFRPESDVKPR
jgi:hypothetical protein